MQIEQIKFDNVRYNPERAAFETLVEVRDGELQFSYPAHVCAPLNAEFAFVARGLAQAARTAHRRAEPELRMQHGTPTGITPPTPRQKTLLDRLLAKVAA
ncbi:hypothetical protein OO012_18865 [Rhodobacteraceae bacterium KMM 6894]|nr:hypothetical protein [Rhodobacteraceae bacterium KMM 6894]